MSALNWGILAVGVAGAFAIQTWPWHLKSMMLVALAASVPAILFLIFITTRHIQIIARKRSTKWHDTLRDSNAPTKKRKEGEYYLFVLGSGGHTKEMLMMMDDGTNDFTRFHRRYVISSGDTMSLNHLQEYEDNLKQLCEKNQTEPGSFDTKIVTRARRVHQSLLTTPFSAFLSINDIIPALRAPPPRGDDEAPAFPEYPSQVFSNGPATSFFVAVVIYALKVFYVVPEECMRFVYIESWARISTLSLTGKLFYYTGLADQFFVQHDKVAERYGIKNAGQMVFNTRRFTD